MSIVYNFKQIEKYLFINFINENPTSQVCAD